MFKGEPGHKEQANHQLIKTEFFFHSVLHSLFISYNSQKKFHQNFPFGHAEYEIHYNDKTLTFKNVK